MASCLKYIQDITPDVRVQDELQKVHNSIFDRLTKSKLFQQYNDIQFLPANRQKYDIAKRLINKVNDEYKTNVAGTGFTKETGKEYLFVNIKNLAGDIIDSFYNFERRKFQEQIDEFGDSTPRYNRQISIKPGVEELFDSNPELANQVYEALGYKTEAVKRVEKANEDIKEIQKIGVDTEYEDVVKSSDKNRFHFLDTNIFTDKNQKSVNIEHVRVPEKYRNKGYGLSMYIVRGEELLKEGKFLISYDQHSPEAETVWQRLLQLGLATQEGEYGTYQYVGLKNQEITPEQKQQALQQYSQYLNTIFPDSKVKDIVYHGSIYDNKKFKDSTRVTGHYFSTTPKEALQHAQRQLPNPDDAVLYNILLNIKNPKVITKPIDYEDLDTEAKIYKDDTVFGTDYDSLIAEKVEEYNTTYKTPESTWLEKQIVVFEPEQIHILGSKQDIEGFRKFLQFPMYQKLPDTLQSVFEKDPDSVYSFIYDQLNNISPNGTTLSNPVSEESIIKQFGQEIVDQTKSWALNNQLKLQNISIGAAGIDQIVNELATKLTVAHEIIDVNTAYELTKSSEIPYNGEPAFYYNEKVYLVKGKFDVNSKLHELIHPFVRALAKYNPDLFNRLYTELSSDPEYKLIMEHVANNYSELANMAENGKVIPFMEEFLTYAIQKEATSQLNNITKKSFLKRVWDAIRYMLKSIFKPSISVSEINANSTISELTKILLFSETKIDLSGKDGIWNYIFPMYNRDFVKDLEKIQKEKLNPEVEKFYKLIKQHVNRLVKSKNLTELRDLFGAEDPKGELQTSLELFEIAEKFMKDIDNDEKKLLSFAEGISSLSVSSNNMLNHIQTFINRKDISDRYKIGVLNNYMYIVKDWEKVLADFLELTKGSNSELRNEVLSIKDKFDQIGGIIGDYYKNDGLVKIFMDDANSNILLQAEVKKLEERIEFLKKDYESGNKAVKQRLQEAYDLYNRIKPTEENFKKWLSGEMGDANMMSMMVDSYTSNPNPIVGGFTNWFFKEKIKVESKLKDNNNNFLNKLKIILDRFNLSKHNVKDLFSKITDTIEVFYQNSEGVAEKRKVRVFANQYAGDYDYVVNKYLYDLDKLDKSSEEHRQLFEEFQKYKIDYMFSPASDVVAKSTLFWSKSPLHMAAYNVREQILSDIRLEQSRRVTDEERLQQKDNLKLLWRRYSRLYSTKRSDGTDKSPDFSDFENNIEIANIFKEHREQFGDLYERQVIPGAFENARKVEEASVTSQLIEEGLIENTPEFSEELKLRMRKWLSENIRIANSQKFYEDRQKLIDELKVILDKLNPDEKKNMDITKEWEKLFDIVKGYRDEDTVVIGSDLTESQQKSVLEIEEAIEKIKDQITTKTGLSREEGRLYNSIYKKIKKGEQVTDEERTLYEELSKKKKEFSSNITKTEERRMKDLIEQISNFQSRIPTEYYIEEFTRLSKGDLSIDTILSEITVGSIEQHFIGNPEFEKWFMNNHRVVATFDKNGQKLIYKRSYAWSRIIPKDSELLKMIMSNDFEGLMASKNAYIEVTPSNDFTTYQLKEQYKTPQIVGVTVDNRGNFLPKPTRETANPEQLKLMTEKGISFAKDGRYESKVFKELNTNKTLEGYKFLNELIKEYHLKNQEGSDAKYTKLWYEVPRMRRKAIENATLDNAKTSWQRFTNWLGRINPFTKEDTEDQFSRDSGSWNPEEISSHLVMTDLWGERVTNIPIKYTTYIPEEEMSEDSILAVMKYGYSVEVNKFLRDVNPVAQSLKDTLLKNKPSKIGEIAKNILGLKVFNLGVKEPGTSVMYRTINNFTETFIEGKTKHREFGVGFDRFSSTLMKAAAFSSLALQPVAAVRNLVSGNIQKTLEGITGRFYDAKDIAKGEFEFDKKFIPALMNKSYSITKDFYTQMFQLFDPLIEYDSKVGESASKAFIDDIVNGKFLYMMQKGTEIHVQGSTWMAMMMKPIVDFTDETGEIKKIPYIDAWEFKDNLIQLRQGVDPSWDKTGDNFAQFVLSVRKVNERLQGAYANENAAEYQRYSSLSLVGFMRKYFIPMFRNRFQFKSLNTSTGEVDREGYYTTTFKLATDTLKNKNKNWHTYSEDEKRNALKFAAEIGYSMGIALIMSLLGWDEDDEDKYDKLRNDWFKAYLIYQLLAIKSETETFIPWFGLGIDEWYRNITTPSVAFNVLGRYKKAVTDLGLWITNDEDAYYDKSYGVYEKGDVKFLADISKITGFQNWLLLEDPTEGVKRYVQMSRRY